MVDAPAIRRWVGFLALPANAALGLRLAWASADALWRWAGDRSTDANHYSKRAILAEILIGALSVRLADGEAAAQAYLDRRIEAVMAFERLKAQISGGGHRRGHGRRAGAARYGLPIAR